MEPKWDAKWSPNGVWAPSGAKMAPERQKRRPGPIMPTHFGCHFRDFGASFSILFFEAFLEAFFFASRATLGRHRWPKGLENVTKMEPKATLGVSCGKCKNHGRGYVFSTRGSRGESGRRLFPHWVSRPILEVSLEAFLPILGDFGCPLDIIFDPLWT